MTDVPSTNNETSERRLLSIAWALLAIVIVLGVPQFLRMPLTNDPVYYDLQADDVRQGGVLYRDMMEPNFPGVVWLHLMIRPLLGKSSEALRLADFGILCGSVTTLAFAVRRFGGRGFVCVLAAAAMLWCYMSLNEWSHCQRDPWLLLPVGLAMLFRERQISRVRDSQSTRQKIFACSLAEGMLWGVGVWIKPHVAISAVVVWLLSLWFSKNWRRSLVDTGGLIVGGSTIGALGCFWLIRTGAWPYFWDTLLNWNPLYVAGVRREWSIRFLLEMCFRFFPWVLLHLVALPWALVFLLRRWTAGSETDSSFAVNNGERAALWSGLYLSWMLQAAFLQILFDYVHVPCLILVIALVVACYETSSRPAWARWGFALLAGLAFWASALPNDERLALWPKCLVGPNSPALRDQLRLTDDLNWEDLEKVAQFLEAEKLKDGDLVCYNNHLIHLYPRLNILPKIRFVYQATHLQLLAAKKNEISQDFLNHPPRFIVSDLKIFGLTAEQARQQDPKQPLNLPLQINEKLRSQYPLKYPVVFRAGGILVHRYKADEKE